MKTADPVLVTRVNRLYHDLTQDEFDREHRARHRVERSFWERVGRTVLGPATRRQTGDGRKLRVVDLACGTGFVTETLRSSLRDDDALIAVDLSPEALETTGRKLGIDRHGAASAHRVAADVQSLPLPDESVHLVAMNAGLHHIPDPISSLREIDRVLKPGGVFALGFEPNSVHFRSYLSTVASGLWLAAWYLSPRQNRRRVRERVARWLPATSHSGTTVARLDDPVVARLNEEILREGIIEAPLPKSAILDLVDPHARGAHEAAGFNPNSLRSEVMAGYTVIELFSADFLGETARHAPIVRESFDALLRLVMPLHGSLFCWLLQKPEPSSSAMTAHTRG